MPKSTEWFFFKNKKEFDKVTLVPPCNTVIEVFFSGWQWNEVEPYGSKHKIIIETCLLEKIKNSYPHGFINTLLLKNSWSYSLAPVRPLGSILMYL